MEASATRTGSVVTGNRERTLSSVCNGRYQGIACKRYGKRKAEMGVVKICRKRNFIFDTSGL
jgi:hypothetical protein